MAGGRSSQVQLSDEEVVSRWQRADFHRYSYLMRKWLVRAEGRSSQVQLSDEEVVSRWQGADLHRYSYLMRKWLVDGRGQIFTGTAI